MILLAKSNVRILDPVQTLDYFDTQSVDLGSEVSPLQGWNLIMQDPQPVLKLAFRVRDAISGLFGVKQIRGFSGEPVAAVDVGDHLDFFLVEYADPATLVLTERDRHLDVMTCISTQGPVFTITSSVRVHNWFGRLYMVPVGIAHKWIVRSMLGRIEAKVAQQRDGG